VLELGERFGLWAAAPLAADGMSMPAPALVRGEAAPLSAPL
jgi:hypothetical protein